MFAYSPLASPRAVENEKCAPAAKLGMAKLAGVPPGRVATGGVPGLVLPVPTV